MNMKISSEEIYNDILKKIINLELEPGSMISENKICEEYNVSRSVIRNVFARLSQINFINIYPQRGTYINKISPEYLKTALIIRAAIEKEMIYRLLKLEDKNDILKKMQTNINQQENLSRMQENQEEFNRLDEEFHKYILSVENNSIMPLIDVYLLHIKRWKNIYIKMESDRRVIQLIEEHKQILNAIKENQLSKALECMSTHIHTIEDMVEFNKYTNYFE